MSHLKYLLAPLIGVGLLAGCSFGALSSEEASARIQAILAKRNDAAFAYPDATITYDYAKDDGGEETSETFRYQKGSYGYMKAVSAPADGSNSSEELVAYFQKDGKNYYARHYQVLKNDIKTYSLLDDAAYQQGLSSFYEGYGKAVEAIADGIYSDLKTVQGLLSSAAAPATYAFAGDDEGELIIGIQGKATSDGVTASGLLSFENSLPTSEVLSDSVTTQSASSESTNLVFKEAKSFDWTKCDVITPDLTGYTQADA
jgi:hypothetical protein